MRPGDRTADVTGADALEGVTEAPAGPGLVLVFSSGRAAFRAIRLAPSSLELGRTALAALGFDDDGVSRRHVAVSFDGSAWTVEDLGSRNGASVDGERVRGRIRVARPRVLALGRSVLLFAEDLGPIERAALTTESGVVIGPTLRASRDLAARAAKIGDVLHVTGESGAGKELLARHFHASGPRPGGPFVAVNCAAIPEGVAERLLFGAVKGAYSGAANDAQGYAQAADGGTLFLDEIAELDHAVQGKVLRLLEAREVTPLGASRPRTVDVRLCSATHQDLRALVAAKAFREDLYFRIGRPEVSVPPLRARLEEISWIVQAELAKVSPDLAPHVTFVEACLGRPWPGNVRELAMETRSAAHAALAVSRPAITAKDLPDTAGMPFAAEAAAPAAPDRARIEEILASEKGNVTRAARALGMHRNQLRRWLAKEGLDPGSFGTGET